ncbi:MAG: Cardiolipin synthetase [Thermoleophilia bacterium]|nr:Cardiolipin synthetase [Thermoleophilia bacterium]
MSSAVTTTPAIPGPIKRFGPTVPEDRTNLSTPDVPNAPGSPIAGGSNWALWDESNAVPAIVAAIDNAKTVVNAEYFQITDAGKGAAVTSALARAAGRGVEVNVIADFTSKVTPPLGSFGSLTRKIEGAGGNVIVTSRIPGSPRAALTPALRHVDHRKVLTIDGTSGFVGGMNLATISDNYHDSMLQLSGVDAARLGVEQLDRWGRVGGQVTSEHVEAVSRGLGDAPLVPTDPTALRVLANAPEQERFDLSNAYVDAIRGAKTRLWVSSPGYSSQPLISELADAVERGVDVRIVAPGGAPAGIPVINWLNTSHLKELTELGAKAFMIPEVLHRKALISDDTAFLSSFNVTDRSRLHDHEIGIMTKDPDFVAALSGVMTRDMDRSSKLDPKDVKGWRAWVGDMIAQKLKISY